MRGQFNSVQVYSTVNNTEITFMKQNLHAIRAPMDRPYKKAFPQFLARTRPSDKLRIYLYTSPLRFTERATQPRRARNSSKKSEASRRYPRTRNTGRPHISPQGVGSTIQSPSPGGAYQQRKKQRKRNTKAKKINTNRRPRIGASNQNTQKPDPKQEQ